MTTVAGKNKDIDPVVMAKFVERSIKANKGGSEDKENKFQAQDNEIIALLRAMKLNAEDREVVVKNISKIIGREVKISSNVARYSVVKIGDSLYYVEEIHTSGTVGIKGCFDKNVIPISVDQYNPVPTDETGVIKYWTVRFNEFGSGIDAFVDSE